MKIVKFHWVKKGNMFFTHTPFGPYMIKGNSSGKLDVLFNNLLIITDCQNSVEAKKLARKDFKEKVRECITIKEE